MHAIIMQKDGKCYLSPVFGYYVKVRSKKGSYKAFCEEHYSRYYIIWNADKTRLIKWYEFQQGTRHLISQILIVDSD